MPLETSIVLTKKLIITSLTLTFFKKKNSNNKTNSRHNSRNFVCTKKALICQSFGKLCSSLYSKTSKTRTKLITFYVYLDQNYSRFHILFDVQIANYART